MNRRTLILYQKTNINKTPNDTLLRMNRLQQYKKNGITVLENSTETELVHMIQACNRDYYNTQQSMLTDNEYDILKEYMERKYPMNKVLQVIGEPVAKNKVTLPYEMASMNKIKPDTQALSQWMQAFQGPYVLSCKLDGVSGLLVYDKKGPPKLYTRGDGKVGQDISHFIPVLNIPISFCPFCDKSNRCHALEKCEGVKHPHGNVAIRGEFILPKHLFETKYKNTFANARNLVSGIINSKTIDAKAQDMRFVAYEVVFPEKKPQEQFSLLEQWKHEVVRHVSVPNISNDSLSKILLDWRSTYEYEIDGIIVTNDAIYPRVSGNPEHAFAFKMVISDQLAEAKVVDVIWTPSKDGYLKPRVRIEPIRLCGVTIEYATGFNGKFIEENKIGIGAVIQIIRSGDVIPHIKSVTTPAETVKMPDVPYRWTDTHVDIVLEDKEADSTVREKNATQFFVSLKVEGLSVGNVKRLFRQGFDTVPKIIKMTLRDWESIDGFKEKMSEKIHTSLSTNLDKATLLDIMVASNKMGRGLGERKIQPILETIPDILSSNETTEQKERKLMEIKGIGKENAREFVQNIPGFLLFLKECGLEKKIQSTATATPTNKTMAKNVSCHPLYQKKIVMTKIRDKELIQTIESHGGTLGDNMTKEVFVLIVKSKEDTSSKTDYAIQHNIPRMTVEEFRHAFLP